MWDCFVTLWLPSIVWLFLFFNTGCLDALLLLLFFWYPVVFLEVFLVLGFFKATFEKAVCLDTFLGNVFFVFFGESFFFFLRLDF
jgi:hypothetical protein